jgi:hypothetical protein
MVFKGIQNLYEYVLHTTYAVSLAFRTRIGFGNLDLNYNWAWSTCLLPIWVKGLAKIKFVTPCKTKIINSIVAKDRQCTYKLTLRRVRETIVAMEKQKLLHVSLFMRARGCVLVRVPAHVCVCVFFVFCCQDSWARVPLLHQHATRMHHIVS